MAISRVRKIDDMHYDSKELDRPTTASSYKPTTVMRYMGHRTVGLNVANSFQGSLRNFVLSSTGSSFKSSPISTDHGLASLVHSSSYSTMSPIHSIDGERAIDEQRELSRISATLTESILQCCNFEVHNRAQELQIEWLKNNANRNCSTIEKMFRTEIQTAKQLIDDALRSKPDLQKKLNDIHQTTLSNDESYQQLLSKRNATNVEIFDYQRHSAQTRAESEFLRCRIQQFNDEIHFYTLKNDSLQLRQVKLRYELDEDIFAKQVLQTEFEVLQSEKITNEDIHLTSIDDVRGSIDKTQIATMQPSNYYREQLTHEVRRFRSEYEKKIQTYREELHRKFELEFHRYQMCKSRPGPTVTIEHDQNLDQFKRERKTTEQQITSVRSSATETQSQIEKVEDQIIECKVDLKSTSKSERHLAMLEQIIQEREKQLNHAIRIRTELKQRTDRYRQEVDQYSKGTTEDSSEIERPAVSSVRNSVLRSPSTHEFRMTNYQPYQSSSSLMTQSSSSLHSKQSTIIQSNEKPFDEELLVRPIGFEVEQDCKELNKILTQPCVDEVAVIRILCNRSLAQRLQIRDIYKTLFHQELGNVIESGITGDSKSILKILLLSPIERDCYELRRICKEMNIDENIIIEIFLSYSNKQIKTITSFYSKLFNSTLEQDIIGDRETPSKRIYLALLQANRPENDEIKEAEVLDDARHLYETNSTWKTDGSTFIRLLSNRSNAHLKQTFAAYQQFSGIDIEQIIKIDTAADLSRTLMAIVRIIRNQPRFYAYQLRKSLKGSGTNEDNLTRIIVSRCEIDIVQIKSEYEKITQRTLFDHIQTDTKGSYKRALLELLCQRIEPINTESSFKQLLESSKKTRPSVQWKEPLYKKSFGTDINSRNGYEMKQFDRNNQAKRTTLLKINTKPSKSPYIERRSRSTDNHHK